MSDPKEPVTDADRERERLRQKREKLERQSKEALLGAAGVISLGMLIRAVLK